MGRSRKNRRAEVKPEVPWSESIAWLAFATGLVVMPLWVSASGRDPFRIPKLSLFRADGLALLAIMVIASILGERAWRDAIVRARPLALLAGLAVGWTAVAAIVSNEPLMSAPSIITALAAAAMFIAAVRFADRPRLVTIFLVSPLVVAIVATLQVRDDWNRAIVTALLGGYDEMRLPRVSPISLLGNRNDVGTFLVAPSLLVFALLVTTHNRRHRRMLGAALAVLVSGLVAANTITAIIAFVAALFVASAIRSWRIALVALFFCALVGGMAIATYEPLQQRARQLTENARQGQWDRFLTNRLAAFLAAAEMAADNPLTGVGPGLFKKEYFEYKVAAAGKYPELLPGGGSTEIFEDAHNDHLQLASETGIPGTLLFNASLIALAWISIRHVRRRGSNDQDDRSPRADAAGILALPLGVALLLLAIGQSPLQLAVTIQSYAVLAGLCVAWSRVE